MSVLFMIPARSGSKGVKDKNIKNINAHPLFYYSLSAVKKAAALLKGCRIFFNTDSPHYADLALKEGAEIFFLRPPELAADSSPVTDTLKHTYEYCKINGLAFDYFALIQPTSPLIIKEDIKNGLDMIMKENINSVISVARASVPPVWCGTLDSSLNMENFIPPHILCRHRQDLPDYYRLTGSINIAKWHALEQNNFNFIMKNSRALIIPEERALDIDTPLDMEFAEFMLLKGYNQK
jgi:CMP-N-acetylneuraminic acid synthetase